MELINREQLSNGSRSHERMPNPISRGLAEKGSRNESESENGISHFIEHLV